jgi:hypothetical protein
MKQNAHVYIYIYNIRYHRELYSDGFNLIRLLLIWLLLHKLKWGLL